MSSLLEKIKNDKKFQRFLLIISIVIVFTIFIYSTFFSEKGEDSSSKISSNYELILEEKLSSVLSNVEGAGKVSVVITVESGLETVLAMETTSLQTQDRIETVEKPIIVNGKTVVLKENYPKVKGVLIVAEGAKNIAVLNRIQQATISLLNIKQNQIEILTMK